ncbi:MULTISPECIES: thermonuclease family protein [Thalassospira]|uniref:Nuclease n=2 Tax=Thalassospira TaxID=168934 RepID=A0A367WEQ0_9PROT|nr:MULTISPECIES: thermonuclease family protein [Thalassospira]MDG4718977.1 thermonuclease family protein [Thalassospira sp. FZY0004]RCK39936.1 nuclease [Thalassospira profundimaris]
MQRLHHLFFLIAVPVLLALAVYLQDKPVNAANNANHSDTPPALEAEGRDINVIDGDTIIIDGKVVDIAGLDAPELGQQCRHNGSFWDCGMSAAMQLRKYFAMAPFTVQCWPGDEDRAGKANDFPIVECGIGDRDVAAAMIRDGEALPIEGYSHRYDSLSAEAANAEIGIHGSDMIAPSDWRAGKRLEGETGRCLYVATPDKHYVGTLDPRFDKIKTDNTIQICSDEQARTLDYEYLAPAP